MTRLYLAVILLFAITACQPDFLTKEELSAFVSDEENGLKKSVDVQDTHIDVLYRPTDLWVHQEIGENNVDQPQLDSLRKKYDQYLYFIVSLSRNNKESLHQVDGNFNRYSELVQTLSFRMSEFVNLTTAAQDTIYMGDSMLNRTFGMSRSTDVLFVFSKEKVKDKEWVQLNINEFGLGIGNQRFRFKTSDLLDAPQVEFAIRKDV